ncbi:hypothetical protein [Nocardiopsis sp. JB363]|uniref:hypothetical protein n=1 Tax=Nocardiopsis sp. JB363 TaxID=1434837 RepID=UPI00097B5C84|nr:hypothetical protein [Nocardiopsis sp. JB363]SIO85239.1 hypothetical protein BQ8420_05950 [Nocardiopsis sp. JB363]
MTKRGIDGGSLVAGVLFLGLAVVFVVQGSGSWDFNALWLIPVLFAGLGLAGVARALLRSRPDRSGAPNASGSSGAQDALKEKEKED